MVHVVHVCVVYTQVSVGNEQQRVTTRVMAHYCHYYYSLLDQTWTIDRVSYSRQTQSALAYGPFRYRVTDEQIRIILSCEYRQPGPVATTTQARYQSHSRVLLPELIGG